MHTLHQTTNRSGIARIVAARLEESLPGLQAQWAAAAPFGHAVLDDLLPPELAQELHSRLPDAGTLMLRQSEKERKRVGVALERYDPLMAEILYAFQEPAVVQAFNAITGRADLTPDPSLYGSGISEMLQGDFLLPHLDNSHDGDGSRYRVLNALYYITPGWPEDGGGALELWDEAMHTRKEIHARFNRLVLMETHRRSVHSVSEVKVKDGRRSCISNYYFSAVPAGGEGYIHRTTFFPRPEHGWAKKARLRLEAKLKNAAGRLIGNDRTRVRHRRGE